MPSKVIGSVQDFQVTLYIQYVHYFNRYTFLNEGIFLRGNILFPLFQISPECECRRRHGEAECRVHGGWGSESSGAQDYEPATQPGLPTQMGRGRCNVGSQLSFYLMAILFYFNFILFYLR